MESFLEALTNAWKKEELSAEELQVLQDHAVWVKANRLEPLLGSGMEDWKSHYLQNWGRVKTYLQVFGPLSHAAEGAGLKWIGYRGPFAAIAISGDPALNYFVDLDLLVSEDNLEASLVLFQAHGFGFRSHDFPKSFYRKHHLHYSLQHETTGVLCDLHWAVDHPYTRLSIPYRELFEESIRREDVGLVWWEPRPEHRYILSALHAMKHFEGKAPANLAEALKQGTFRFLLEALALTSEHSDLPARAACIAEGWNAGHAVQAITGLCSASLRDAARRSADGRDAQTGNKITPRQASSSNSRTNVFSKAWRAKLAEPDHVSRLDINSSRHGFRLSRCRELGAYLWPVTLKGRPTRWTERVACALQGGARLIRAAADYSLCSCQMGFKTFRALFVLAFLVGAAGQGFAQCIDDYPGGRESATFLVGDSNHVTGTIEFDIDRDWFCFSSYPGAAYQFDFNTNTIWDVDVKIHAPDGSTVVLATNTIYQAPATWGWTNHGAFGRYYIELGGLVEFTTGTYSMVMQRSGFVDGDGDGLDDGWETDYFASTNVTNGSGDYDEDGFTDEVEYYLTTQPTNKASGLFVVDIDSSTGFSEVTWPSVQNGSYRISRSEKLNGLQTWVVIDTIYETNTLGLATVPDTEPLSAASNRFYRVEFLY
jgi:hypothetical protein